MYDLFITPEDYEASGKVYVNPINCPDTIAIKRTFGIDATLDCDAPKICSITHREQVVGKYIGSNWTHNEYNKVKNGETYHCLVSFKDSNIKPIT